jgi:hypothetical protein
MNVDCAFRYGSLVARLTLVGSKPGHVFVGQLLLVQIGREPVNGWLSCDPEAETGIEGFDRMNFLREDSSRVMKVAIKGRLEGHVFSLYHLELLNARGEKAE